MRTLKRKDTSGLTYKTERDSDLKSEIVVDGVGGWGGNCGCRGGGQGVGIARKSGMNMYTLLYLNG